MMRLGRCGEEDEEVVSMFGFAKKVKDPKSVKVEI